MENPSRPALQGQLNLPQAYEGGVALLGMIFLVGFLSRSATGDSGDLTDYMCPRRRVNQGREQSAAWWQDMRAAVVIHLLAVYLLSESLSVFKFIWKT